MLLSKNTTLIQAMIAQNVNIARQTFDNLLDLEIGEIFNNTCFYFQEYGNFLKEINHSNLKIPLDTTVQWVFFCFIMFGVVKLKTSRNSLIKIFMSVSDMHHFNMKRE